MTPNPTMTQDPAQTPDQPEQSGIEVTITKLADGTFTVERDTPDAVPETPDMESQDTSNAKAVGSIDEALDMARQMLEGDGSDMSPEQAFSNAFNDQPNSQRRMRQ